MNRDKSKNLPTEFMMTSSLNFAAFVTVLFLAVSVVSPLFAQSNSDSKSAEEPSAAKTSTPEDSNSPTIEPAPDPITVLWRIGATVKSPTHPLKSAFGIVPIPTDWPEQHVALKSEDIGQGIRFTTRDIDGGIRQAILEFPSAPVGEMQEANVTFEVTISPIARPEKPEYLAKPRKPSREITRFLNARPLINHRHGSIKRKTLEIIAEEYNDWGRVKTMYEWIRENIELSDEEPKGAVQALKDKKGCREDRVNLFVAMCRSQKIPARTVWADRYEYAEFYLTHPETDPRWLPCQLTGPYEFGELKTLRMIEQKGENFKLPDSKKKVRFVKATGGAETVRSSRTKKVSPSMRFQAKRVYE